MMVFLKGGQLLSQNMQRDLKGFAYLGVVQAQRILLFNQADDGGDMKLGAGTPAREFAEDLDLLGLQPYLFMGFPQRSLNLILILRIAAPAGKADLTGMMAQGFAAPGQQHAEPLVA